MRDVATTKLPQENFQAKGSHRTQSKNWDPNNNTTKTQATQCKKSLLLISIRWQFKLKTSLIISSFSCHESFKSHPYTLALFSVHTSFIGVLPCFLVHIYWYNSMRGGRVASNSQPICLLWGRNMLKHVLDQLCVNPQFEVHITTFGLCCCKDIFGKTILSGGI